MVSMSSLSKLLLGITKRFHSLVKSVFIVISEVFRQYNNNIWFINRPRNHNNTILNDFPHLSVKTTISRFHTIERKSSKIFRNTLSYVKPFCHWKHSEINTYGHRA